MESILISDSNFGSRLSEISSKFSFIPRISEKTKIYEILTEVQQEKYLDSNGEVKKVQRDIFNDLNRTFSDERVKNDENKKKLHDTLLSIALLKPQIGYCQGMNFIAASTLMFFDWEIGLSIEFMYFLIEENEMTFMFVKVNIIITVFRICLIIS